MDAKVNLNKKPEEGPVFIQGSKALPLSGEEEGEGIGDDAEHSDLHEVGRITGHLYLVPFRGC